MVGYEFGKWSDNTWKQNSGYNSSDRNLFISMEKEKRRGKSGAVEAPTRISRFDIRWVAIDGDRYLSVEEKIIDTWTQFWRNSKGGKIIQESQKSYFIKSWILK